MLVHNRVAFAREDSGYGGGDDVERWLAGHRWKNEKKEEDGG